MKFQAWRSITTDQFTSILCIVFCEEIKWIDTPVLNIFLTADVIVDNRCYDDVYWLQRPLAVHAG